MLWINLQATKKVNPYHFAKLEEATYYQYAYGTSNSLTAQATRFLTGFSKLSPFDSGNEASAFIGFVAFLRLNDFTLVVSDSEAADWFKSAIVSPESIESAIRHSESHDHGHNPPTRATVLSVISDYKLTVSSLIPAVV